MSQEKGLSRRLFLEKMGVTIAGLTFIPMLGGCDANFIESIRASGVVLPMLTEAQNFYTQFGAEAIVSGWKQPNITTDEWKLTVDGLGFQREVSFSELNQRIQSEGISVIKTMRCVFDSFDVPGLLSTGVFTGVPLRLFLPSQQELTAKGTKRLRIYATDGFTNNITMDRMFNTTNPDMFEPLLVTQLNGQPLPQKQGFPVRLLVQEAYGYKNVKWISRIEFTTDDKPFGSYQDSGYIDDGELRITSKVTTPTLRSDVPAGKVKIIGMAFSGAAGVDKVEVAIDEGSFQTAQIISLNDMIQNSPHLNLLQSTEQIKNLSQHPYPFRGVWIRWEFDWDATPGAHKIRVKATDKRNNSQPEKDTDSTDGNNRISTTDVTVR